MLTAAECDAYDGFVRRYQEFLYPLLAVNLLRRVGRMSGKFLDLGVGPGYLTRELARRATGDIYAADINPAMLKLTDALLRNEELKATVHPMIADVHDLPFENKSLDAIVSYSCFHHWADPARALREIWRTLAAGGCAAIIDTEPSSDETLGALWRLIPDPVHYRFVEEASAESLPADAVRLIAGKTEAAWRIERFELDELDVLACIDDLQSPPFDEDFPGANSWILLIEKPGGVDDPQLAHSAS
ncbi:MAG: class I SAM-dependent methyltransferase [Rhizomicrobium sp.]